MDSELHVGFNVDSLAHLQCSTCSSVSPGHLRTGNSVSYLHCPRSFYSNTSVWSRATRILLPAPCAAVHDGPTQRTLVMALARCPHGALCPYAHGSKEQLYHPSYYKTMPCSDFRQSPRLECDQQEGADSDANLGIADVYREGSQSRKFSEGVGLSSSGVSTPISRDVVGLVWIAAHAGVPAPRQKVPAGAALRLLPRARGAARLGPAAELHDAP